LGCFDFLPLLHIPVEERVGVRRFPKGFRGPLSLSLSPLGGARGRLPKSLKEFLK
jgi:hypothetical protein